MYTKTPDILAIPSKLRGEVLSKADLDLLKEKTLTLLTEVGMHFPSRQALEIFSDHGADVDLEKEIVKIPPELVLKAMSSAPNSFVLGGVKRGLTCTWTAPIPICLPMARVCM